MEEAPALLGGDGRRRNVSQVRLHRLQKRVPKSSWPASGREDARLPGVRSDFCHRRRAGKQMDLFKRLPKEAIGSFSSRLSRTASANGSSLSGSNPRACEACGETRVLDVAHKPGHERIGRGRRNDLILWPQQVWVLCPTCHALVDRMHYPPKELGLNFRRKIA